MTCLAGCRVTLARSRFVVRQASVSLSRFVEVFELLSERRHHTVDRRDVLDGQSGRDAVDPRSLQAHDGVEGVSTLVGQHDKLCTTMMRMGFECDKPLPV